jgi:hypothetical protein
MTGLLTPFYIAIGVFRGIYYFIPSPGVRIALFGTAAGGAFGSTLLPGGVWCVCARAVCVRACMHACVCVCVRECVFMSMRFLVAMWFTLYAVRCRLQVVRCVRCVRCASRHQNAPKQRATLFSVSLLAWLFIQTPYELEFRV